MSFNMLNNNILSFRKAQKFKTSSQPSFKSHLERGTLSNMRDNIESHDYDSSDYVVADALGYAEEYSDESNFFKESQHIIEGRERQYRGKLFKDGRTERPIQKISNGIRKDILC